MSFMEVEVTVSQQMRRHLRNILQVKAKPCRELAVEYLLESTNV